MGYREVILVISKNLRPFSQLQEKFYGLYQKYSKLFQVFWSMRPKQLIFFWSFTKNLGQSLMQAVNLRQRGREGKSVFFTTTLIA